MIGVMYITLGVTIWLFIVALVCFFIYGLIMGAIDCFHSKEYFATILMGIMSILAIEGLIFFIIGSFTGFK